MTEALDVTARMAELEALGRPALCQAWRARFGKPPPDYTSMGFMRKVLIWEEQAARYGGIPPYLARALKIAAEERQPAARESDKLRPGAQLIREWNGRSYQVEVTREGFRMDGREYRSLSAIARRITGVNWSGPRFFGLVTRKG